MARQRFDVADAAPLLLDAHGLVTGWTRDAQRLLEYPASEAVGQNVADLLTAEDAARRAGAHRAVPRGRRLGGAADRPPPGRAAPVRVMVRITVGRRGADGSARWLVLLSEMARGPRLGHEPPGAGADGRPLAHRHRHRGHGPALRVVERGPGAVRRRPGPNAGWDCGSRTSSRAWTPRRSRRRCGTCWRPASRSSGTSTSAACAPRRTGRPRTCMSFTRLDDDRGHPMGVYYTVVDITERHRARQRLALLDRAGEYIGRSLDIRRTAQELADVAVPALADSSPWTCWSRCCGARSRRPDRWTGRNRCRCGGPASESVQRGRPGGRRRAVGEVGRLPAPASPPLPLSGHGHVLAGGAAGPAGRGVGHRHPRRPRQATFLDLGLHSVMIVPIRARGVTLGVTTFFRRHRQEPFDEDDLSLAEDLVSRAAVCVDNARRYTRERDAALVLQRSLLPHRLPEQDAVEVAACYRPADELTGLGGDWYDLIPLSGARVALVVGEVPGHGIDAAAAMGRLRTAVRTLAALDLPPEEVLAHLDDLVARRRARRAAGHRRTARRPTARRAWAPGVCTSSTTRSTAGVRWPPPGIPRPPWCCPTARVAFVDLPAGAGARRRAARRSSRSSCRWRRAARSRCTPTGCWPAARTGPWTRAGSGCAQALERAATTLDLRCRAVVDALVPARPHDDVALLMARTRLLGAGQVADWDAARPTRPWSPTPARRPSRQLADWGLEELGLHHGAGGQRAGHQRHPARRRPDPAPADPGAGAGLRGVRRRRHRSPPAPPAHHRRGRARAAAGLPVRPALGHPVRCPRGRSSGPSSRSRIRRSDRRNLGYAGPGPYPIPWETGVIPAGEAGAMRQIGASTTRRCSRPARHGGAAHPRSGVRGRQRGVPAHGRAPAASRSIGPLSLRRLPGQPERPRRDRHAQSGGLAAPGAGHRGARRHGPAALRRRGSRAARGVGGALLEPDATRRCSARTARWCCWCTGSRRSPS